MTNIYLYIHIFIYTYIYIYIYLYIHIFIYLVCMYMNRLAINTYCVYTNVGGLWHCKSTYI